MKSYPKKGFTLLEILLVIALLAILFATVLYALNPSRIIAEANDNKRKADALTLYQAIEQYALKTGSYPSQITALTSNSTTPICKTTGSGCIDLTFLVPAYISSIPSYGTDPVFSGFSIVTDNMGRLTISGVNSVDNTTFTRGQVKYTKTVTVEYLIVGGGASGSHGTSGFTYGGGGGGGQVISNSGVLTAGSYSITIGAGGAGVTGNSNDGNNGGNSTFNGLTANGGNKGLANGDGGASGGAINAGVPRSGITGGGGGGSGAAGSSTTGGMGISSSISGTTINYGGGGGGSNDGTSGLGTDGGGNGASLNNIPGNGIANQGGGGGGTRAENPNTSGAGGSGVVIIRYKSDGSGFSPSSTGGTQTISGGWITHTFTSSGTFTAIGN